MQVYVLLYMFFKVVDSISGSCKYRSLYTGAACLPSVQVHADVCSILCTLQAAASMYSPCYSP